MSGAELTPVAGNPEHANPEANNELLADARAAVYAIRDVSENDPDSGSTDAFSRLLATASRAAEYLNAVTRQENDGDVVAFYRRQKEGDDSDPVLLGAVQKVKDSTFITSRRGMFTTLARMLEADDVQLVDPDAAQKAAAAKARALAAQAEVERAAAEAARRDDELRARREAAGPALAKVLAENNLVVRILADGSHRIAGADGKAVVEIEKFDPASAERAVAALALLGFKQPKESESSET